MTTEKDSIVFGFRLLFEASKKLHGYVLHTWLKHYLDLTLMNMRRLVACGGVGPDFQPTEETDYRFRFDMEALDAEKLSYVLGFYLHILSSHKKANYWLMKKDETKRVLYLRGFDYEGSVSFGGGLAMSYESVDTGRFTHNLAERLRPDFELFTALSPRDLFAETAGTQKYFRDDYDRLVQACSNPIRSIYLNANHWKDDVSWLFDRMDYFVVYVSSITDSVLWELDQLKEKKRTADATVVFDESAIALKEVQFDMQERMEETAEARVVWSKSRPEAPTPTAPELRESLARDFLVVTSEEFFGDIERHKTRIAGSQGPLGVGSREGPLPFRFYPAQDEGEVKRLRVLYESLDASISGQISSQGITNLPWFLNIVQLKILASVMLGRHDETGRALAVYAAVMDVARKRLFVGDEPADDAARDSQRRADARLEENSELAHYASPSLIGYGESHDFVSKWEKAQAVYKEVYASASKSVGSFFDETDRIRGRA